MGRKTRPRKIKKGIPAILAISFFSLAHSNLHSQDLSWDEIAAIAEKNNPSLEAARASVQSSQFNVSAVRGDFLPGLSGNGSYTKSNAGNGTTQNNYSLSLTAQQSLFSGFRTKANYHSAKIRLSGAEASLDLEEARVFNELRSSYLNLLYAQENIKLLKKILDRKEANKRLIELRFQAGRENRGAFLRANAQLSQSQFELNQAERSLNLAKTNLARAMGRDPGNELSVTGKFEIKTESVVPNYSSLALLTPSYKRSETELQNSRAGLMQTQSDFYPSVSLSASGRRSGEKFPLDNDSWSVGASVSFPFFSGGRNYYSVKQTLSEIVRASAELESARRQVIVSLEEAFIRFQDAAAQVEIQKQFLEAAEERAKIARAQYNNGLVSYQDWDIIENDLTNTEKQTLESLRRAGLAEANWIQTQGLKW